MASDTRTLTVNLVAEVASLKKGLSQAQSSFKNFETSAKTTANVVKTAFAALSFGYVATQVSRGISSMVSSFNETRGMIEDTKHLAEALGAGTEEVQAIRRAAEEAEIPVEALEKNIKILTKSLGNASMGTGPAVDALAKLGLNARQMINIPLHEQLTQIGEGLSHVRSQAQRAAIAAALFGKSGIEMLPFLEEAAPQIRELFNEMQSTGELFSMEEAKRVDAMGDAMNRVYGVFQGLKQQLTIQFAPAVQYVAELLQDWTKSMGGAREMAAWFMQHFIDGAANLADGFQWAYKWSLYIKGVVLDIAKWTLRIGGIFASIFGDALQGDFTQMLVTVRLIGAALKTGILEAIGALAKGLDAALMALPEYMRPKGGSTIQGPINEAIQSNKNAVGSLYGELLYRSGGMGGNDLQNIIGSMANEAYRQSDIAGNMPSLGGRLRDFFNNAMNTSLEDQSAAVMKGMIEDTYDILPPLKAQKDMNDEITDQLKEQNDWQKEINKNTGSGTAMRQGEFSQAVGGVYGNGARPAGVGPVSPTSAASGAAIVANNTRNGADSVTGLLQGILTASQQIAVNTARAQVAVAG